MRAVSAGFSGTPNETQAPRRFAGYLLNGIAA
jgi:hypothetical protein